MILPPSGVYFTAFESRFDSKPLDLHAVGLDVATIRQMCRKGQSGTLCRDLELIDNVSDDVAEIHSLPLQQQVALIPPATTRASARIVCDSRSTS